jgi:acetyl esterase
MAQLDPTITRQFAWGDTYDLQRIIADPVLAARMLSSYRDDAAYDPPTVPTREVMIDGPLGDRSLRVRVYTSADTRPDAVLVWSHGGGFSGGDLDMQEADGLAREVCARAAATVISVDYHLADGTVAYPTLHRDVAAALRWARDHVRELARDGARITLGGASAGANLSVAATLELRDNGEPLPDALLLAYPLLHEKVPGAADPADLSVVPQLLRVPEGLTSMILAHYRGASIDEARYLTTDGHELHGLPPTLVIAAEYDDFRGSADAFVTAARASDVAVQDYLAQGVPHGYLNMTPALAETARTLDLIARYLK